MPVSETIVAITCVGVVHQPLLRAQQDPRAALEAVGLPCGLRRAGAAAISATASAPRSGTLADDLPGGGVLDGDLLAGAPRRDAVVGLLRVLLDGALDLAISSPSARLP